MGPYAWQQDVQPQPPPTDAPPMIIDLCTEAASPAPATQTTSKKDRKLFPREAVFLAYPLVAFTITALIMSIVRFNGDKDFQHYNWSYSHVNPAASILCFVTTPLTLLYLLLLLGFAWFPSKVPYFLAAMKPLTFACINFAYTAVLVILWGVTAGLYTARIRYYHPGIIAITVIAGIELAFLCLLCVVYLFYACKAHCKGREGAIRLPIDTPRIVLMINGTPYIDIPSFESSIFSSPVGEVKTKVEDLKHEGRDVERLAGLGGLLPTYTA